MNAAQIPYCLLNGFQDYPEVIASDVDFMVHPSDAERIAPLLLEVAGRCGALLVQAIRHETGAWYFVLAKQVGWRGGLPASGLHDRLPAGWAAVAGGGTGAREAATVIRRFSCRQSQTSFCTT